VARGLNNVPTRVGDVWLGCTVARTLVRRQCPHRACSGEARRVGPGAGAVAPVLGVTRVLAEGLLQEAPRLRNAEGQCPDVREVPGAFALVWALAARPWLWQLAVEQFFALRAGEGVRRRRWARGAGLYRVIAPRAGGMILCRVRREFGGPLHGRSFAWQYACWALDRGDGGCPSSWVAFNPILRKAVGNNGFRLYKRDDLHRYRLVCIRAL
jgi:hypothetical protein